MTTVFDRAACTLYVGEQTMTYIHHGTDIIYTFSVFPMLIDILSAKDVCPNRDISGERLSIQRQKGGARYYKLDDLAYACYHGWIKSLLTWEEDMDRYKSWKGNRVIDHADNNHHNATEYNLSIMARQLNSSKGAITEKVKLPVRLCTAYVGNEYRVQVCWETIRCNLSEELGTATMHFICESADDFVDCLKQVVTISPEWYEPLKKGRAWKNSENENIFGDIDKSVEGQRWLATIDRNVFDIYQRGQLMEFVKIIEFTRAIGIEGENAVEFINDNNTKS